MFKIQEGIVTSSVIVMHLYSLKQITWLIVGNEIAILTIGIKRGSISKYVYAK